MRKRIPSLCPKCGIQDNDAHRKGMLHTHFSTIKILIEAGVGNNAIIRAIGLNPSHAGHRTRMRHIRARLAKIGICRDKFLLEASASVKETCESPTEPPSEAMNQAFGRRAGI
jgi:hypothetical protein